MTAFKYVNKFFVEWLGIGLYVASDYIFGITM